MYKAHVAGLNTDACYDKQVLGEGMLRGNCFGLKKLVISYECWNTKGDALV